MKFPGKRGRGQEKTCIAVHLATFNKIKRNKMKNLISLFSLSALLISGIVAAPACAQTDDSEKPKSKQDRKRPEFVDTYNQRHATQKPLVGDTISPVDLFDAEGNRFSTKNLAGKYSVLVFGCLT
jgi:cytochrome oxidase Cu insertion factor (SCO1/SenC/PrrC family)